MKKLKTYLLCAMFAQFLMIENAAAQQTSVPLGTASSYAVLAGSTITNTGATTINGDVGLSPGTAVTGFPPGTVVGTTRTAAAAAPAQAGLVTAYNDAAGRTPVTTVATELGGQTLVAGVYNSAAGTFGITGILTLDGQNDANAVFIFQAASTLTTAAGAPGNPASQVVLINGAQPCNVFWQVGSSATLGTYSVFQGSILALTSITVTTGATINGRALARNGAVTLDTNSITTSVCAATQGPDLTISKTHLRSFRQGDVGDTYILTANNLGGAATAGMVTVSDTLPVGLTATDFGGPGWICTVTPLTCTRSDALAASSSYPAITLTVNVASNAVASLTNTATVSGGGEVNTSNDSASDVTPVTPMGVLLMADLTIAKTHLGNFTRGQTGATYTITVGNVGSGTPTGSVTVSDALPTGLTATAISGPGWSCTLTTLSCIRNDALSPGTSYPAITLTVNVGTDVPASVTNRAIVSGSGEINISNNTAVDVAIVTLPSPPPLSGVPDLTIAKTHLGNFTRGQTGAAYTIAVSNVGTSTATGAVTASDTLPPGLTATAISGPGWTCTLASLTCTRSDALAAGASYPVITVTVNVAVNVPASVTNTATVSGGGETNISNNTAVDVALTGQPSTLGPDVTIIKSHVGNFRQGDTADPYTLKVTNVGEGPTTGVVTVSDTLPPGLTSTAISGPGWSCTLNTLTCTRSDVLAGGASYPAIRVTVSVADSGLVFNPVAGGPEFQSGDILISMKDGTVQWRRHDWTLVKVLTGTDGQAKGMAWDSSGNLFVTHWTGSGSAGNNVARFDRAGDPTGFFGTGYNCNPTATVTDNSGNVYVGQADCGGHILKFDSSGNLVAEYTVAVESRGSSHIVLDPNQCTMYYTSEGPNVKQFNICSNTQMPDFNSAPLPDPAGGAQEFSLLPGGGMLISDFGVIARLDSSGKLVSTYNAPAGDHCWLGMALDPDGTSFWASNWCESTVVRFGIASGSVIESHVAADHGFLAGQRIAIPGNIFSSTVTNTATVAGGGESNTSNDSASDATTIDPQVLAAPLSATGIVNAASYMPGVAAGSIATIFGSNLASGQASAKAIPLPAVLAGSTFEVGNFAASLFFVSPTQVNLQVPWEVAGHTQAMVNATVGAAAISTQQMIMIDAFAPGIFTLNEPGSSQGVVLIAGTQLLAAPAKTGGKKPVAAGKFVSIYCTGLGAVSNQPATGFAAKADPLSFTSTTPTVTIGGIVANVSFSGLAPGSVGLYQVNVQVPMGTPAGDAVPVILKIGGVTSNTVTIAVAAQ